MPPTGRRQLTTAELSRARCAYEQGASYQQVADRVGVPKTTLIGLMRAVGVTSRPQGWPKRPKSEPVQPRAQAAVQISPAPDGRLRIPSRTAAERRLRAWTAAELQAIDVEVAAGRVERVPRGRSGLPERPSIWQRQAAEISFYRALQRLRAAA